MSARKRYVLGRPKILPMCITMTPHLVLRVHFRYEICKLPNIFICHESNVNFSNMLGAVLLPVTQTKQEEEEEKYLK